MRDPHAGKYEELTSSRQRGGGGWQPQPLLYPLEHGVRLVQLPIIFPNIGGPAVSRSCLPSAEFRDCVQNPELTPPSPVLSSRHRRLPVTLRQPSVGAWPNYYLALQELLCRHPDADAVMIVQDDACCYDRENLREYLDQWLWPSDPPGLVSLYCSSAYTSEQTGWQPMAGAWIWGALAFVFPRERAIQFVTDREVIAHRWTAGGLRLIDEVIGKWAQREGVPIHFPTPSLVQHLGTTSTIWPGLPSAGYRRADWFAGNAEREP